MALQHYIGEHCTRSNMLSALFDYVMLYQRGNRIAGLTVGKGHEFIETIRLFFGQYTSYLIRLHMQLKQINTVEYYQILLKEG